MFTWLNKQGVKSDKGFEVQCTGRFSAEYREGSKKISIATEPGKLKDGRFCDIISINAFVKWDDGTPIPEEKQKEIFKNYTDAIEFQGMGVIVDENWK